jgi:hypothetical protein
VLAGEGAGPQLSLCTDSLLTAAGLVFPHAGYLVPPKSQPLRLTSSLVMVEAIGVGAGAGAGAGTGAGDEDTKFGPCVWITLVSTPNCVDSILASLSLAVYLFC